MPTFENGVVIKEIVVGGRRWRILVTDVYNPSAEELASNKAFNDTLGNWEPDRERPTQPQVGIEIATEDGQRFEMYWLPAQKVLGPHMSLAGWGRESFNAVKGELLRWSLL